MRYLAIVTILAVLSLHWWVSGAIGNNALNNMCQNPTNNKDAELCLCIKSDYRWSFITEKVLFGIFFTFGDKQYEKQVRRELDKTVATCRKVINEPRLDMYSDETFQASQLRILESLTNKERESLLSAFALIAMNEGMICASNNHSFLECEKISANSIRKKLDGKTAKEILKIAYKEKDQASY